jgi:predicted RNA-binding protein
VNTRRYWLDLFSGSTWDEFHAAGAEVSGFRERRWKTVQRMKPGDYLLCYLTGVSRWIGILEVVSEPYMDTTPIWADDVFPARMRVKPVVELTPETAVPIMDLRDQLSIFQNLKSPDAWTGYLRGSPSEWSAADAEVVVNAIMEAKRHPVVNPIDPAKLARRPPLLKTNIGLVTVPEKEEPFAEAAEDGKQARLHAEIQWLLLKLGNDMGLDVWVAQNDRGLEVRGQKVTSLPRLKTELPVQFNEATNRTIRHIDVLWLRGNAIVAAFEIECTTSIYSGLLRMSDLIAMQPNLNISLYLVAPDERRNKVIEEVNRPTFSRLTPPLRQVCKFMAISTLRDRVAQIGPMVRYMNPEFLTELSESCIYDEP